MKSTEALSQGPVRNLFNFVAQINSLQADQIKVHSSLILRPHSTTKLSRQSCKKELFGSRNLQLQIKRT